MLHNTVLYGVLSFECDIQKAIRIHQVWNAKCFNYVDTRKWKNDIKQISTIQSTGKSHVIQISCFVIPPRWKIWNKNSSLFLVFALRSIIQIKEWVASTSLTNDNLQSWLQGSKEVKKTKKLSKTKEP